MIQVSKILWARAKMIRFDHEIMAPERR